MTCAAAFLSYEVLLTRRRKIHLYMQRRTFFQLLKTILLCISQTTETTVSLLPVISIHILKPSLILSSTTKGFRY